MPQLTWLITGCSSGFGTHFVHSLLARGDRVIATGRHASTRLHHLRDTGAAILDLDVTLPQPDLDKIVEEALKIYGGIDVLVNNAGYIESGMVEELTPERLTRQLNTNLFGPINLSRSILPHFREKRAGVLVFIGSQAGWQGEVGAASYCASKFALEGVVECLRKETTPFSIQTIIFEPGYYRTQALSPTNIKHSPSSSSSSSAPDAIPDYAPLNAASLAYEAAAYGNEPGDPKKAVERMIDVVRGEGMARGREMPVRLPLGRDGLKVVRAKCEETLRVCGEWEDLIGSTDLEEEGK